MTLPTPLELLRIRNLGLRDRLRLAFFALRVLVARRERCSWRFGSREVYFSKRQLYIDLRVFAEVFFAEDYRAAYDGAVVVDLGAHKGYYGAYALLRGAARVISYEPERRNFAVLACTADSFRSSGCSWTIHKAAVGAHPGSANLHVADESWAHSFLPTTSDGGGTIETVRVVPIARVLEEAREGLSSRVIAKIDVEGAECEILRLAPLEIWNAVDEVLVEAHAFAPCSRDEVVDRLAAAGLVVVPRPRGAIVHAVRVASM